MHTINAWQVAIALLLGTHHPPASAYSPDRVHLVVHLGPDTEPDIELEPEPKPVHISPRDEAVLEFITASAGVSVRDTAGGLGMTREMVRRSLDRLRAVGRVEFEDGEGWLSR
ncbi:MAG: hypothetical protein Q8R33_15500 [Burkholderiales bacterium]|nr:hypothetical protein [Burkholderiales bacterium]